MDTDFKSTEEELWSKLKRLPVGDYVANQAGAYGNSFPGLGGAIASLAVSVGAAEVVAVSGRFTPLDEQGEDYSASIVVVTRSGFHTVELETLRLIGRQPLVQWLPLSAASQVQVSAGRDALQGRDDPTFFALRVTITLEGVGEVLFESNPRDIEERKSVIGALRLLQSDSEG